MNNKVLEKWDLEYLLIEEVLLERGYTKEEIFKNMLSILIKESLWFPEILKKEKSK